ncbi:MAG TPA: hypothetical protein PLF56_11600 [Micropruina sp.]|nr:hypothetical protein [Micropruina sp.]
MSHSSARTQPPRQRPYSVVGLVALGTAGACHRAETVRLAQANGRL